MSVMYGVAEPRQISSLFGVNSPGPQSSGRANERGGTDAIAYGVNTAKPANETAQSMLELKTGAFDMTKALNSMNKFKDDSVASKLVPKSSEPSVLAVQNSKGAAKPKPIEVEVAHLAEGQTSKSDIMRPNDTDFEQGSHKITLQNSKGKAYNTYVRVESGDTNEQVMRKFADSVNSGGMGVSAEVSISGGKALLTVRSTGTGTKSAFSLTSNTSFIGTSGLSVTRPAQNASYSVNGSLRVSQTNDVTLKNNIKATLKNTGSASVQYERDNTAAVNAVTDFASAYNKLASSNDKMAAQMSGVASAHLQSLSKAGFEFDGGKMSISDKAAAKAVSNGSIRSLVSEDSLTAKLSKLAKAAERAPQKFSPPSETYVAEKQQQPQRQSQLTNMLGLFYDAFI